MNTQTGKTEIDLLDIWRIALRKKWIIISLAVVLALFVAVKSYTTIPQYRAKAKILIEEPNSGISSLESLLQEQRTGLTYTGTYFKTQLELLMSRTLAQRVSLKMDLGNRSEVINMPKDRKSPVGLIKDLVTLKWLRGKKKDPEKETPEDEGFLKLEETNSQYYWVVRRGLGIHQISDTRLVEISHRSYDPLLSADIVNNLSKEFINYTIEMRYAPTQQASEFLEEEIAKIRRELSERERELQKYSAEKNLVVFNNNENDNTVLQGFEDLARQYRNAMSERYKTEAMYMELKDLDADTIPSFITDNTLQSLRSRYLEARNDYDQKIGMGYRPDYPEVRDLSNKISGLKTQLQSELGKAINAARAEYNQAQRLERTLELALNEKRDEVFKTSNDAIYYQSMAIEVRNKRELLNTLDQRRSETQVTARLKGQMTSNIKIIDPAQVPVGPMSKNTVRNMMIALMLGVFLGAGIAFFIEYMDNSIKDPDEIEKSLDLPSLGIVPFVSPNGNRKKSYYRTQNYTYGGEGANPDTLTAETKEVELINHLFPSLSIAEDYRTIRTSILFSHAGTPPKILTFTSAFPQEGKSATISNLSVSFSQLNKKVLLIDADLRRPRLHKIFKAKNIRGLSNFLTGKIPFEEATQMTAVKNLWIIPSGPNPPNPAELLDSDKMKELLDLARRRFDVVLIDSPPVLAVIDPVILSSMSDSTVIVVRPGKTSKKALTKTVHEVRKTSAQIIGVIYNEAKTRTNGSYYYSPSYHGYMNNYYQAKETTEMDEQRN
ncbi:GumC family protein [Acidobacteriota bacterium]